MKIQSILIMPSLSVRLEGWSPPVSYTFLKAFFDPPSLLNTQYTGVYTSSCMNVFVILQSMLSKTHEGKDYACLGPHDTPSTK